MAIETVYRQLWTAGTFENDWEILLPAYGGTDTAIPGYPEAVHVGGVIVDESSGKRAIRWRDVPHWEGGYDAPNISLMDVGPEAQGAFDTRGCNYELECFFPSTSYSNNYYVSGHLLTVGYDLDRQSLPHTDALSLYMYAGSIWKFQLIYRRWFNYQSDLRTYANNFADVPHDDAWHRIRVRAEPGTITGNYDAVASDGFIRVYLDGSGAGADGTLIYEVSDIDLVIGGAYSDRAGNDIRQPPNGSPSLTTPYKVHGVELAPSSALLVKVSDVWIYREVQDDETSVCACEPLDGDTVNAGGGQSQGASPWLQPVIGIPSACSGGGLVPTQADLVHSEQWWGL